MVALKPSSECLDMALSINRQYIFMNALSGDIGRCITTQIIKSAFKYNNNNDEY